MSLENGTMQRSYAGAGAVDSMQLQLSQSRYISHFLWIIKRNLYLIKIDIKLNYAKGDRCLRVSRFV